MTPQEARKVLIDITQRRKLHIERLVAPAQAAANQMRDAGMREGALPLLAVLSDIAALDQEVQTLIANHKEAVMIAFVELVGGKS